MSHNDTEITTAINPRRKFIVALKKLNMLGAVYTRGNLIVVFKKLNESISDTLPGWDFIIMQI